MWSDVIEQFHRLGWSSAQGSYGLLWAAGLFVLSNLVLIGLVVGLPATFFCGPPRQPAGQSLGARSRQILKNVAGVIIVLVGFPMALPGVPGPGIVVMLVGLMLIDFPGKRKFQRAILGRPGILSNVNRLRARFGRPPFVLDQPTAGETPGA
jgi:hypothetical protein